MHLPRPSLGAVALSEVKESFVRLTRAASFGARTRHRADSPLALASRPESANDERVDPRSWLAQVDAEDESPERVRLGAFEDPDRLEGTARFVGSVEPLGQVRIGSGFSNNGDRPAGILRRPQPPMQSKNVRR